MYRLHGTTRNPYNVNHYPGGSSSGSAAAVAAGNAPVNPLSPDIKIHILLTVLNTSVYYGTSKGNFSKYQDISSLVITSFILIT